jgi:hypothetical protein
MCEYGLIPMVKTAEFSDVEIESKAQIVLTDNVDVPQCPNSDLNTEMENI